MKQPNRTLLILLSLAGTGIMVYLTILHFSPGEGAFCNLGEGFSCSAVNKSIYAEIFGVPVAVLGLLYFLGVLAAALLRYNTPTLKAVVFLSIVFLGPSLYLTGIEYFALTNICIFCEISKVLMIAIAAVSWHAMQPRKLTRNFLAGATVLAITLAGIVYAAQATSGPSEDYTTFAQCLTNRGFIMYGSAGCSFCARQKALFGGAARFIKEVECDPRYPDDEVERCVAKNIEHTPTWIQEDADGNELYRFEAGVQSLDKLAEASGCSLREEAQGVR